MSRFVVMMEKKAKKDYDELVRQGNGEKINGILMQLEEDPFKPPFERLSGEYRDYYSRRVNRIDRVVYRIIEGDGDDPNIVVVVRMRTHYRGLFSFFFV